MTQPNDEPLLTKLVSELNEAIDEEETAIRQPRRPGAGPASPRPVDPVAGPGAERGAPLPRVPAEPTGIAALQHAQTAADRGHAGPFTDVRSTQLTGPTITTQLDELQKDAERTIEAVRGMQLALAVIRRKLA